MGELAKRLKTLVVAASLGALLVAWAVFGSPAAGAGKSSAAPSGSHQLTCPSQGWLAPVNHNPLAASVLVPDGARAVLLCRYYGDRHRPTAGQLAGSAWIKRHSYTRRLTAEFDRLEPVPHRRYRGCGPHSDGKIDAIFEYREMPDDVVTASLLWRCHWVSNHRLRQSFWLSTALSRQLLRATEH